MAEASLSCERDSTWTAVADKSSAVLTSESLSLEGDVCMADNNVDAVPSTRDDCSGHCSSGVLDLKTCLTPAAPTSSSSPPSSSSSSSSSSLPASTSPSMSSTATTLPNFLRIPAWGATTSTTATTKSPTSTAAGSEESPLPTAVECMSRSASSKLTFMPASVSSKMTGTKTVTPSPSKPNIEQQVIIKTEDDIKDYVETTMNELLGWYGLPKMDKSDTPHLNIQSYPGQVAQGSAGKPAPGTSGSNTAASNEEFGLKGRDKGSELKLSSDTNNNSSSCGADDEDDDDDDGDDQDDDDDDDGGDLCGDGVAVDFQEGAFVGGNDVVAVTSLGAGSGEVPDSEKGVAIVCSWCQQNGNKLFALATPGGVKSFCSELCFTQCRRASFKRNKVCEWCKHVRHTVNFVDFQDGDVQLQFCSEKCLNQYKMNIFCTEARQHLQHIQNMSGDEAKKVLGETGADNHEREILITPDLWLSAPSNKEVTVKEELSEEVQENGSGIEKNGKKSRKKFREGEEPGEMWERESRWAAGVGMSSRTALSDDSSCSNEERLSRKMRSCPASRQKKDSLTSRLLTSSKPGLTLSDPGNPQDRRRSAKEASSDGHLQQHSPATSSANDRENARPRSNPQKNATFPASMYRTPLSPDQALSLLPPWTQSLLPMMPSPFNPSLTGANLSSSLTSLGYPSNPLLYSSLFGPASLPAAVQKEAAVAKSRNESRRELVRDRSLEGERENMRGDSIERSALSTSSSSYSSSDTPTPGVAVPSIPDLATGFVPGFTQRVPHPLSSGDLNPTLSVPHYLTQPPGMFQLPLSYILNHAHRGGVPAPAAPPHHLHGQPTTAAPQLQPQQFSVPPVTVLVPYPIAVPVPIPIPVPLPIAPEKLYAYFKEKSDQAKTPLATPSTHQWSAESSSDQRPKSAKGERSRLSSHPSTLGQAVNTQIPPKSSSIGCHIFGTSLSVVDGIDPLLAPPSGRDSSDSVTTLRQETARCQQKGACTSPSSSGLKRLGSPATHYTLDLSKKTRQDNHNHCSEDEAMDLSKMSSRSSSPRICGSLPEDAKTHVKQTPLSDSDLENSSNRNTLGVSRIHIISDQPDAPLCQPSVGIGLPPMPDQSSYSGRRSRILDAPSVPKRIRSPSPERRYVRTVPRDMVDAARRRGLRARVRTK